MASSFKLYTDAYDGRYLRLTCTQTKDIVNNRSLIEWTLTSRKGNYSYYDTGPTDVYIGGKHVYHRDRVSWNSYAFPAAIGSVSGTVYIDHEDDGSAKILCTVSTAIYNTDIMESNAYWTLDDIPRNATLTSAPNFTDEDNPTIVYSNPAGESVDSVLACISDNDGATILAAYREIPKTGSSYTFKLTDEERQALINEIPDGKDNVYVRFYVKTIINGETIEPLRYLTRILTITNATPELTVDIKDIGAASTALTGDEKTIIKGFNYVHTTLTPTLKKGASVKKQSTTNGNQVYDTSEANFNNTEDGTFIFSITDSFGQTVNEEETLNVIPYVKLTCNLSTSRPSADGDIAFKISGNYFNDKFGEKGVDNTLALAWRIKENNDDYGEWISIETPTISDNTYVSTINLTGLNYRSIYTIQARAGDKISSNVLSSEHKTKSIPVFNWGEDNFDFNVPVTVEGDGIILDTKNKFDGVLEVGSYDSKTGVKTVLEGQFRNAYPVEIEPDTTYTISVDGVAHKFVVLFYDQNKTFLSEIRDDTTGTITSPADAKYLNFRCFSSDYTDDYVNYKIQIEPGTTVTECVDHRKYGYKKNDIVNLIYPIGSVYMSINSIEPSTLFGGTWEQLKDKFLLAAGDTYTAGDTGGEATHTLTVDEIPPHTHQNKNSVRVVNGSAYYVPGLATSGYDVVTTGSTGGGQAHNNMPPYLAVYMWKRIA